MKRRSANHYLSDDPLWYKDAVIYELHVRAFHDSDGDGIGDFRGLTQKLDYLQELGITAIWLLPFYPSPLKDDGYDIADYTDVNPFYGTLRDFDAFLEAAHARGIRVITELVINHTSDQHAWFQRARRAKPGSAERDFYMWSDTADRYKEARIIFKDFEQSNWAFDSVANAYYWHRFYSHQPDLNFDSVHTRRALKKVLDFWLGKGVDGMRLDAVPYLYAREGTNCENLPETHAFLRELRAYVDENYANRMLLAEANQWPEDAAAYFGDGDECHMNFHFPLMPRLFMSLYMEDRFPIIDILEQTPPIPETSQWALFLRNHDELTLEMVTDEERDYMYRIYAQDPRARVNLGIRRRLAPLLDNNRRRIELMNGLLLSLPGTPVIYYGDEIGMGDNVYLGDRNGVRTPMQWSADRNAGFSRANPQSLYLPVIIDPQYHYETVNVDAQLANPSSLFWWMKRTLALRRQYAGFGRGSVRFLLPHNRRVLAFFREYGDEVLLVVANLSRFAQYVELDLSEFRGRSPVELFGNTTFPPIEDRPYFLSLGAHSFYWFALKAPREDGPESRRTPTLATIRVREDWEEVFADPAREALEVCLPAYIKPRRWFRSKASQIESAEIVEALEVPAKGRRAGFVCLVKVSFTDRDPQTYLLPLRYLSGQDAAAFEAASPHGVIALLSIAKKPGEMGIVCDAAYDAEFMAGLLEVIERRRELESSRLRPTAVVTGVRTKDQRQLWVDRASMVPAVGKAEQSNTSIVFGEKLILKLYRLVEPGENPEVEIGNHLTEIGFSHVSRLAGYLEYRVKKGQSAMIASVQQFVPNDGDAWQYTLEEIERFFDRAETMRPLLAQSPIRFEEYLQVQSPRELPTVAYEAAGGFFESARLLGQRTAEMHAALADARDKPSFEPEPFTPFYRRSLYQSLRNQLHHAFSALRQHKASLAADVQADAEYVLEAERRILKLYQDTLSSPIAARRQRVHGDYHLGQVLYTGKDFVIIDFEGEPTRSIGERRVKRCPLIDVAGMLRSFQYAAFTAFERLGESTLLTDAERSDLRAWTAAWYQWIGRVFLDAYLRAIDAPVLGEPEETERLLRIYVLEKAVYELAYELNNRPEWARIPIAGIAHLLHSIA